MKSDRITPGAIVMAGPNFADIFENMLVPSIFRPWGLDMLDRVPVSASDRVVDVGCGTGILARLVRERAGPQTDVQGVDLSALMIGKARAIAPDIGWHEAGAEKMPLPDQSFDVALCQQAFQFFPDRDAAAREMHRVLTRGGRVAISTWRPIEECELFYGLDQAATRLFGPRVDRRHAFGDGAAIGSILAAAGFRDIHAQVITRAEHVSDARTFVRLNLGATYPPINEMSDAERESAIDAMMREAADTLEQFAHGRGLVHPMKANLVTAVA
jgi:ubiquinone/menaquinone biosynthesis C-methylase UbiE